MAELKPCPFCGGEATVVGAFIGRKAYATIRCEGCKIMEIEACDWAKDMDTYFRFDREDRMQAFKEAETKVIEMWNGFADKWSARRHDDE